MVQGFILLKQMGNSQKFANKAQDLQQDQIKAVNNDLINKIPALQQQFDGYKAAYSDYETKLNIIFSI